MRWRFANLDSEVKGGRSRFRLWPGFSLTDCPSRSAWYRWLVVLATALSLAILSLPAAGQDGLDPRNRSYDYTIGGVQYRVPARYMPRSTDPRYRYDHLTFAFWLSDGKPIGDGVPPIGTKERHGRGWYWPPEPGRPFFSGDDFLVFVSQALPLDPSQGMARQRWPRERVGGSEGLITREDGLDCRSYPTGAKLCFTPLGDDPDVSMDLGLRPDNPVWAMKFYSRADSMWVKLDFPGLGQSRWPEVVCRTLLLVRTWRISAGPPPPDCFKSPRLSSLHFPESWS